MSQIEITRELLANTRWQTMKGEKIPITNMADSHIANSIRMLENLPDRQNRDYSLALLKAEQVFRKRDKSLQPELFNLPIMVEEREPEIVTSRPKVVSNNDLGELSRTIDNIFHEHHGMWKEDWNFYEDWEDWN